MRFEELYDRIIELWPETIDISDGCFVGYRGVLFPTLNKAHHEIEKTIDYENDHWGNIGVWSFFQAFHAVAKDLKVAGKSTLFTRKVSKKLIDEKIKSNLGPSKWDDAWGKEREEYQGL